MVWPARTLVVTSCGIGIVLGPGSSAVKRYVPAVRRTAKRPSSPVRSVRKARSGRAGRSFTTALTGGHDELRAAVPAGERAEHDDAAHDAGLLLGRLRGRRRRGHEQCRRDHCEYKRRRPHARAGAPPPAPSVRPSLSSSPHSSASARRVLPKHAPAGLQRPVPAPNCTPGAPLVSSPGAAGVAQLARASACHAEGRGFESLHPLHFPLSGCEAEDRGDVLCRLPLVTSGGASSRGGVAKW